MCAFYNNAARAIKNAPDSNRITWRRIRNDLSNEYVGLTAMKLLNPETESQEIIQQALDKLLDEIESGFQDLESE